MADKVNSSRTVPYPYRSASGTFQMRAFEQSTAVSTAILRVGDLTGFDPQVSTATGRLRKCSTMANVPNVLSTGSWLGLAMEAGDPAVTAAAPSTVKLTVCLATAGTEFWFPTKSSAVTSTCINVPKALGYDSTLGMFYVDMANSTAGDVTVVVTDVPEPGTDANNPVIVKFLSSVVSRLVNG